MVVLTLVIAFSTNMYAIGRDVSVSLCPNTDANIRVTIDQGELNPIVMAKDETYMIKVYDKISLYVFSRQHGCSQSYPIKPSTTALVLRTVDTGSGANVQVEQSSEGIYSMISSAATSLVTWFFIGNE
jgi:hypothetical protein